MAPSLEWLTSDPSSRSCASEGGKRRNAALAETAPFIVLQGSVRKRAADCTRFLVLAVLALLACLVYI